MAKQPVAKRIPFRMHPRVFESLGSDLVTSDLVAITELVKNSYDAFASRVDIRFKTDPDRGPYIEIADDGEGMAREVVEEVWCVVATPHRQQHTTSRKAGKSRRVSGEKGLGRLSVARLGDELEMFTQAKGAACLKVEVTWSEFGAAEDLSECVATVTEIIEGVPTKKHGTVLRIFDLNSVWTPERFDELQNYLSRLISPFKDAADFEIWLHCPGENAPRVQQIVSTEFLSRPKYKLVGSLDASGRLVMKYAFRPLNASGVQRSTDITVSWEDIQSNSRLEAIRTADEPLCGPFSFEIRAWDIGASDIEEIVDRFRVQRARVREAIRFHKGISVYRDGILVLPKSENARDWLGLDLRRVSDVGKRLSTSQIVGYVAISAEENPKIKDTSDRERLVHNRAVAVFEDIIKYSVMVPFEKEREKDRLQVEKAEQPLKDLFGGMKTDALKDGIQDLIRTGKPARDAKPLIDQFSRALEETRTEIERRFVYYSRLATVGTLAQMLVHEVRSRVTVLGDFLDRLERDDAFSELSDGCVSRFGRSREALASLDRLAETFLPLASRNFNRSRRTAVLEDRIAKALSFLERDLNHNGIEVVFKEGASTAVAIDPGELDAILVNLLSNAVFWLSKAAKGDRQILIRIRRNRPAGRVTVGIHDSGPGVPEEKDRERIFWPGVTNKPGGIGMGLTIVSEIVDAYGGKTGIAEEGLLGGASFEFDLPLPKT